MSVVCSIGYDADLFARSIEPRQLGPALFLASLVRKQSGFRHGERPARTGSTADLNLFTDWCRFACQLEPRRIESLCHQRAAAHEQHVALRVLCVRSTLQKRATLLLGVKGTDANRLRVSPTTCLASHHLVQEVLAVWQERRPPVPCFSGC